MSENSCHFVNLFSFASSSFFLNTRKITWLNSQQPKTRGHVEQLCNIVPGDQKTGNVLPINYSIVKDSSADLGVDFKIVQNRPTVKPVYTKILKYFFLNICQYFYISERK